MTEHPRTLCSRPVIWWLVTFLLYNSTMKSGEVVTLFKKTSGRFQVSSLKASLGFLPLCIIERLSGGSLWFYRCMGRSAFRLILLLGSIFLAEGEPRPWWFFSWRDLFIFQSQFVDSKNQNSELGGQLTGISLSLLDSNGTVVAEGEAWGRVRSLSFLFVCLAFCLFVCLSVCPSVCTVCIHCLFALSVCLCLSLSVSVCLCLSLSLPVWLVGCYCSGSLLLFLSLLFWWYWMGREILRSRRLFLWWSAGSYTSVLRFYLTFLTTAVWVESWTIWRCINSNCLKAAPFLYSRASRVRHRCERISRVTVTRPRAKE